MRETRTGQQVAQLHHHHDDDDDDDDDGDGDGDGDGGGGGGGGDGGDGGDDDDDLLVLWSFFHLQDLNKWTNSICLTYFY